MLDVRCDAGRGEGTEARSNGVEREIATERDDTKKRLETQKRSREIRKKEKGEWVDSYERPAGEYNGEKAEYGRAKGCHTHGVLDGDIFGYLESRPSFAGPFVGSTRDKGRRRIMVSVLSKLSLTSGRSRGVDMYSEWETCAECWRQSSC